MTRNKVTSKHSGRKIFNRKLIIFLYISFLKPFVLLRLRELSYYWNYLNCFATNMQSLKTLNEKLWKINILQFSDTHLRVCVSGVYSILIFKTYALRNFLIDEPLSHYVEANWYALEVSSGFYSMGALTVCVLKHWSCNIDVDKLP